jgi:hypothetical protein
MNKTIQITLITLFTFIISFTASAQKKKDLNDVHYHRSSLHMMLVDSNEFPDGDKEIVVSAYHKAAFPEKYNDHRLKDDVIKGEGLWLEESEIPTDYSSREKKNALKKEINDENARVIIEKYLKNKITNKVVAKWFNQKENGAFDVDLIKKRGFYDATSMDIENAKNSVRGIAAIADKGEQLIANTFVVVSKLKYISNEPAAQLAYIAASDIAKQISGIGAILAQKAADIGYEKARKGYSVWTTSYLYKLNWNKETSAKFYEYWVDENSLDEKKTADFNKSNFFKLEYIGEQKNKNIILFAGGKTTNTKEKVITKATVRNIEKVFAKLQNTYQVFQTKTPIKSVNPIIAEIGLKENIDKRSKFEALEASKDELTGKITYKRIGLLKVNKKKIWDNQYEAKVDKKNKNAFLEGTELKGCKACYPGVLIRQIK